jgi:hypothetical protein
MQNALVGTDRRARSAAKCDDNQALTHSPAISPIGFAYALLIGFEIAT